LLALFSFSFFKGNAKSIFVSSCARDAALGMTGATNCPDRASCKANDGPPTSGVIRRETGVGSSTSFSRALTIKFRSE
jgi:hypothetical protein